MLSVVALAGVVTVGLLLRGDGSSPQVTAPAPPPPPPAAGDGEPTARLDADPGTDGEGGLTAQQLGERFGDAVWRVDVEGCGVTGSGSGFAISPELLVTNAHVVDIDPNPTLVSRHGEQRRATVIGLRSWPDLAVLQVTEPFEQWLAWAPTDELVEGQPVTALSYPTPLLTFSVAPGTLMSFQVEDGVRIALASDEITDHGSSGGPLLDDRGRVAGVVTEFAGGDGRQLVGLSYTHAFLSSHLDAIIAAPTTVTADCTGSGGFGNPLADDYGSDAELDRLWDGCADGQMEACDDLYRFSPIGSEYERYGDTCGDRNEAAGWCVDIHGPTAPPVPRPGG